MAEQEKAYEELPNAFMNLLLCAGLLNSISERWTEDVQERWTEKLEEMSAWAAQQTLEVQEFASAFD